MFVCNIILSLTLGNESRGYLVISELPGQQLAPCKGQKCHQQTMVGWRGSLHDKK